MRTSAPRGYEAVESPAYFEIVRFCESHLERFGDCHLGVGWTKEPETALRRYDVMLDVLREDAADSIELLDFGCGASHLYEHMLRRGITHVRYSGLDLSERFLELSKSKHPDVRYYHLDALDDPDGLPMVDYMILNGIFTARCTLLHDDMLAYLRRLLNVCFAKVRKGLAFNVMSKLVDWERDDLFHLDFDSLAKILDESLTRNFVIRHDYRLFEYTVYVYR